jgi:hypothetical protein
MAHFARIDADNFVRQVIVIANAAMTGDDGKESEAMGINLCKSLYGDDTNWVQTSYNGSFRGRYAGSGMRYNKDRDEFTEVTE